MKFNNSKPNLSKVPHLNLNSDNMTRFLTPKSIIFIILVSILSFFELRAQKDTIVIGFGAQSSMSSTSSDSSQSSPDNSFSSLGYLPNENATSRFLSQATLGYNLTDINDLKNMGYENWIENQLTQPRTFSILQKIRDYHQIMKDSTGDINVQVGSRPWRYAWWNYFMNSPDLLRQRVALALSEICVISEISPFNFNSYALGRYYDILIDNALGNYKELLTDITFNPAMAVYLTHMNNPKSNPAANTYPDENYAREIMQLFTIGTVLLNNDGTEVLDSEGQPINAYNNADILEFSKVFTGLTWADRTQFFRGPRNDTSYIAPLAMWNNFHEPGIKNLLNGFQIPDRNPVDGVADIEDAIQNLFDHPNTPPFVCFRLIQRLVTSNPTPSYINDIANVFINNGQGVRGDLTAVVKAILLHEEARRCQNCENIHYGMLREPMLRYFQIHKAFNAYTQSGEYRNDMNHLYSLTGQRPLGAPSVFNFFQYDFQPIGPINDANLFGPEFQITNAQSIQGYINGLHRWLFENDVSDEYNLYSGEPANNYSNQIANLDLSDEIELTHNDNIHILLDKINMIMANGAVSDASIGLISSVLEVFPNNTEQEKRQKVATAIYLIMSSPEYQIKK